MHYKNGTPAHLGDIVKGKGCNRPYEVQGIVVGLTPGAGFCDIHVATLITAQPAGTDRAPYPTIYEEHGTCADFELVHPSPTRPFA